MGYGMSRLDMDVDMNDAPGFATSSRRGHSEAFDLDNEIFHLTRLRSEPSSGFKKAINAGQNAEISTARMLWAREANASGRGRFSSADCSCVLGQYLPVNGPWPVDRMDSRVYVSQFSVDGSLFVAAFQGSRIKIYNVDDGWNVQKDIRARSLRWTITDTSLSPDNQYLVYASMMPIVHIVKMGTAATESHANITEVHEGLDFSMHEDVEDSFGIFSVKFSSDGRELLAGSNDSSIYVYDLEANKLQSRFPAHLFDVNTVAFADETGNVVYSGSDDTLCKVWDRRCSVMDRSAAGVLSGHLEGITFIDSRGDGRYLISNGVASLDTFAPKRGMAVMIRSQSVFLLLLMFSSLRRHLLFTIVIPSFLYNLGSLFSTTYSLSTIHHYIPSATDVPSRPLLVYHCRYKEVPSNQIQLQWSPPLTDPPTKHDIPISL